MRNDWQKCPPPLSNSDDILITNLLLLWIIIHYRQCNLFLGETGAGKSTVLNLLLEENLLPTHALPCSSVVTRISYAEKNSARIIYRDDREDYIIKKCDINSLRNVLGDILFEKDVEKRIECSDVKEVQIHLSANILRVCGALKC